ncbi:MAG: hypothetical protein ABI678_16220, partial [Kofleriaceae bacterium]
MGKITRGLGDNGRRQLLDPICERAEHLRIGHGPDRDVGLGLAEPHEDRSQLGVELLCRLTVTDDDDAYGSPFGSDFNRRLGDPRGRRSELVFDLLPDLGPPRHLLDRSAQWNEDRTEQQQRQ